MSGDGTVQYLGMFGRQQLWEGERAYHICLKVNVFLHMECLK
jgi:hypothetical protein